MVLAGSLGRRPCGGAALASATGGLVSHGLPAAARVVLGGMHRALGDRAGQIGVCVAEGRCLPSEPWVSGYLVRGQVPGEGVGRGGVREGEASGCGRARRDESRVMRARPQGGALVGLLVVFLRRKITEVTRVQLWKCWVTDLNDYGLDGV